MTSKLTRERIELIANFHRAMTLPPSHDEIEELARMALAAMDSEPVFTLEVGQGEYKGQKLGNQFGFITLDAARKLEEGNYQLYAAQPAPGSVPDSISTRQAIAKMENHEPCDSINVAYKLGWNACRAAMLHAQSDDDGEPTDDERIMAIEGIHNCERCGDEGWVVGEMGITRCACGRAGNSPAQYDCCPAQNGNSPEQHSDRPVAWHHTAKCKDENHSTCCFSYSPTHDFGPWYEKPQSQPHYLPERLDYDRALHFLSTEPRKVTLETVIGGNSPVIPDGYVMVPKEPTAEMQSAGASAIRIETTAVNKLWTGNAVYRAMLAAAPQEVQGE